MAQVHDAWKVFLNPDETRSKLIQSGIFLVAFEMLRESIIKHIRSFYWSGWSAETGDRISPEYKTEVLALDPKKRENVYRSSVEWLKNHGVIDDIDIDQIRLITDARNTIAHEMSAMLSGEKPAEYLNYHEPMMQLISKIEKWWIINVELPTNPDYDGQEINEEGIVAGPTWVMNMLVMVALGEGDKAWDLHNMFYGSPDETKN